MMTMMRGTIASSGYAYGQAFLFHDSSVKLSKETIPEERCEQEKKGLRLALQSVRAEIQGLQDKAEALIDEETQELFQSYQMLLEDDELIQAIEASIEQERATAAWAVSEVMGQHADAMAQLESHYLRERAADIRDLQQRLVKALLGVSQSKVPDLSGRILVAEDLSPAQSVQLNLHTLQGLVTDLGGETSHTSILARALNIPAIVGTRDATRLIHDSDWILMDAVTNQIWVNPEASLVQLYEASQREHADEQKKFAELVFQPARTRDGRCLTLAANVGLPAEIPRAKAAGAEGIGLFRTEFLFMNRTDLPDEEEQFTVYKSAVELMSPHAVIVRLMDVGGDKALPHLGLDREDNPFLGLRGIRVSLRRPDLMRTQLRALLRASAFGSLKIMVPMISAVEEIIEVQRRLQDVREELTESGYSIAGRVDIGIMIETPASVMLAPHLIRHVDFFSLGTNDLTQYTLAVDRGHVAIRDLYNPLSPAVLIMIHQAIEAAVSAGKWAGVCGELAADPMAALLLVGMGASELSMSVGSMGRVKQALLQADRQELRGWAERCLQCATAAEVKSLLETFGSELFHV